MLESPPRRICGLGWPIPHTPSLTCLVRQALEKTKKLRCRISTLQGCAETVHTPEREWWPRYKNWVTPRQHYVELMPLVFCLLQRHETHTLPFIEEKQEAPLCRRSAAQQFPVDPCWRLKLMQNFPFFWFYLFFMAGICYVDLCTAHINVVSKHKWKFILWSQKRR